jgi:hypothetical protein
MVGKSIAPIDIFMIVHSIEAYGFFDVLNCDYVFLVVLLFCQDICHFFSYMTMHYHYSSMMFFI